MYMHMCIYVCIYICIHIYLYMCIYIYIYTYHTHIVSYSNCIMLFCIIFYFVAQEKTM